jgi:hypothetical protein
VSEHEDDGEGAIQKEANGLVREVEVLEKAVENAVGAENGFPCVAANEIADPQGNDDELIEEFFTAASVEGKIVGERIAEKKRENGDRSGDTHGAKENFEIDGVFEKGGVILEIPVVDDDSVLDGPQAVNEHEGVRKKKEGGNPEERRDGDEEFVGL